jgi:hypothetical protein
MRKARGHVVVSEKIPVFENLSTRENLFKNEI